MDLFIADLHFGHAAVMRMDKRPFGSVEEMDEYMIARWNDRVRADDDVWVVGDFAYRSGKPAGEYLRRLTGKKHLIVGNHDSRLLKDAGAMKRFESADYLKEIDCGGRRVVLCHYPLAEWPGAFRGAWHVYGHVHANLNPSGRYETTLKKALNAGCMITGYAPCSLRELEERNEEFRKFRGIEAAVEFGN